MATDRDDFPELTPAEWDELEDELDRRHRPNARRREAERAQRAAAEADMRAEGLDPATGLPPEVHGGSSSSSSSSRRAHSTSLAAGALGLVAYAVAINYLEGGWAQVKGWLGAKFVNEPYTPPAGAQIIAFPTSATTASTTGAPAPGVLA